jgi:hypothetical protein
MTTVQEPLRVTLYEPHVAQMRLHASNARFRVLACGRRFGKTLACCNEVAKYALENNDSTSMWVAPTYRQTLIAFRIMLKALKHVFASDPNKSEMRLELINGSVIQFASAERYDNLRGEGVGFLVMDEVGQIDERAWTESLRATLSDTGGRVIFIGTPRGRNWFWKIFQMGLDPREDEWASFTFPTAANPYIPAKEIASAKRNLPEDVFKQEYEAEFLAGSAGVFRNIDACIQGEVLDPQPGCFYMVGWDPAKHEDFSVVTVLNLTTRHVDYWERFNKIDYTAQIEHVVGVARWYNHASIEMDATGVGDPLLEQVRNLDVVVNGTKFTNVLKEQMIRNLAVMLEHVSITFPPITVLIEELRLYSYYFTIHNNVQYEAPPGAHDDAVTSLGLVAWKAREAGDIPFSTLTVTPVPDNMPTIEQLDDAFLMQRQERVAASIRFLQAAGFL